MPKPSAPPLTTGGNAAVRSTRDLHTFHLNPRVGDVSAIAASLDQNGQYRPIVVNLGTLTGRPDEVLAGNHTLLAARQLGWPSIQTWEVDVDDLAAARIVAADNRTADLGSYDEEALVELLSSVAADGAGLAGTGYTEEDLGKMLLAANPPESADSLGDTEDAQIVHEWGVIIMATNEAEQESIYETVTGLGMHARVVAI